VATVDRLSGGRFTVGVGVGWLAEEFEALGIPFERRGQRTREYVEVMRKLWNERSSSHQGEFVNFTNVLSYPKPVSDKGVPVWFGGESNPALRRVASTATVGLIPRRRKRSLNSGSENGEYTLLSITSAGGASAANRGTSSISRGSIRSKVSSLQRS
jgi:hypothetical protein